MSSAFSKVAAALFVLLAFGSGMAVGAEHRQAPVVFKFATQAPKGMGYANAFKDIFIPAMDQATEKTVFWKVYWGGIMGNDDDYVRKMAIGQLQGGGLTLVGTNMISPEYSVLALPFLFNDYDEVDFVRDRMHDTFDSFFMKKGFKLLMWIDQDFDLIYSTKWKFDTLEDYRRAKLLTWSGPIEEAWMKALGSSPIVLGIVESPAAIRSGIADSNITTGIWQVGTQVFTTSKYVSTMKIRYTPASMVLTKKAWESIPENYRDRITSARPRTLDRFNTASRKEAKSYYDSMIKYGVTPVTPGAEVRAEIRRRCISVWPRFTGKLFPKSLLDEIVDNLESYRKGGKGRVKKEIVEAPAPKPVETAAVEKKPEPKPAEKPVAAAPVKAQPKPEAKAPAASSPFTPKPAFAVTKETITAVQEKLAGMGLYTKKVDGISGPGTRRAIRAYQGQKRMPRTGAIDEALMKSLGVK